MNKTRQNWRRQADTADLRELWELLRTSKATPGASGSLHVKSLLARVALRGLHERGATCEEIAAAIGLTPAHLRSLQLQPQD